MKKMIFTILVLMVFLGSCRRTADNLSELKMLNQISKPVCIIWYKPGKVGIEQVQKWCDANEMSKIISLLIKTENPGPLNDKYQLSIIFYDGRGNSRAWKDRFEVRGGKYIGLFGTSKELGEMFSKYLPEE